MGAILENNIGMEILVILAILAGPFIGIWAQNALDKRRQSKERKLDVFKTLMATRAASLSEEHVHALNRIDIEFNGAKEKEVRNAWSTLLDHFGESPKQPTVPGAGSSQAERDQYEKEQLKYNGDFARWIERMYDLRTKLLLEMGTLLDYDFNEVHIRKGAYNPRWLEETGMTAQSALVAANEVFTGQRWLPMYIVNWPEQEGGGNND